MIETRLAQILSECRLAWVTELNRIQASASLKGQFGSTITLFAGMSAFEKCLDVAVTVALKELGENFETRNRRWHRFHDYFDNLIVEKTNDVVTLNSKKMYDHPLEGPILTEQAFITAITSARSRVLRHKAGWSAPKPAPWYERHKVPLQITGAVLIYLAGLYTNEVRTLIDETTGSGERVQHDSELPNPPPTPAPAAPATR